MSFQDVITKGIAAHGTWKAHLNNAITTGKSETTVAAASTDNQCAFGKWLHGPTIGAPEKAGGHYETVCKLHSEFHKAAGEVLGLALAGKKEEAQTLIATGSKFSVVSGELTRAMMKWRQ